ncbi:MAG: hypothetical protein QNJ33_00985 [Crocosphaera sp.]|nr:hypothetical protein [Crocosphaera sp.]
MKPFEEPNRQPTRVLQQLLKIDEEWLSRLQSIHACLKWAKQVNFS